MQQDETQLGEGETAYPFVESRDFKEEKKEKKVFTLGYEKEERKSEFNSMDNLDDSEVVNQYMRDEE
jgi:hypothetical protein